MAKFSLATLGVSLDDHSEFVVDVGGVSLAVFDVLGRFEQKLAPFVFVCQIVKAFSVKHCELLSFLEIGGAERRVESELAGSVVKTLLVKLDFLWLKRRRQLSLDYILSVGKVVFQLIEQLDLHEVSRQL